MKAIGYIRVSTQGQVDDGVSLAAQESKIHAWATLNNAEVVICRDDTLRDILVSGESITRFSVEEFNLSSFAV